MPSSKRPGEADDGSASPNKIARTDTGPQQGLQQHIHGLQQQQQQQHSQQGIEYGLGDYGSNSGSSKKRGGGGASTRTGQACDRCKVRTSRQNGVVSEYKCKTDGRNDRSVRFAAMRGPEDVRHVCRTTANARRPIASQDAPPRVATQRWWRAKTHR